MAYPKRSLGQVMREMQKTRSECTRLRTVNTELLGVAREALWFLQNGEIQPNGERHPHTKWFEAVGELRRVIAANEEN